MSCFLVSSSCSKNEVPDDKEDGRVLSSSNFDEVTSLDGPLAPAPVMLLVSGSGTVDDPSFPPTRKVSLERSVEMLGVDDKCCENELVIGVLSE